MGPNRKFEIFRKQAEWPPLILHFFHRWKESEFLIPQALKTPRSSKNLVEHALTNHVRFVYI
jgi:hypothetical protein